MWHPPDHAFHSNLLFMIVCSGRHGVPGWDPFEETWSQQERDRSTVILDPRTGSLIRWIDRSIKAAP